ncbi:MAG TPA: hypothetical protein VIC35_08890 [Acidimicrobiia bacterium]
MNLKTRVLAVAGALTMAGGMVAMTAPSASAAPTPAGTCTGGLVLGKVNPGLTDAPQNETITTSVMKDTTTKAAIGGQCTGLLENAQDTALNGAPPATIHPSAIATKLIGTASCQSGETPVYPPTGKQTISSATNELTQLGKKWQIQSYITITGTDPSAVDLLHVTGIVAKGLDVGAVETATYWQNPVVKSLDPEGNGENNATADGANHNDDNIFNTGYSVDDNYAASTLILCLAGSGVGEISQANAITQLAIGGGGATSTSPILGSSASGVSFALGQ